MKAAEHMWRTAAGDYVPTGHPDAEVLSYPAGDDAPDGIHLRGAGPAEPEPDPERAEKARPAAANKARKPAADK